MSAQGFEVLKEILEEEKLPVTVKQLSRKLKIGVQDAKDILLEFSQTFNEFLTICCIEIIDDHHHKILLVPSEKVPEYQNIFSKHVYSIFPQKESTRITDQILSINSDIIRSDTPETRAQCRILVNPDIIFSKEKKKVAPQIPPTPVLQKSKSTPSQSTSTVVKPVNKSNSTNSKSFFAKNVSKAKSSTDLPENPKQKEDKETRHNSKGKDSSGMNFFKSNGNQKNITELHTDSKNDQSASSKTEKSSNTKIEKERIEPVVVLSKKSFEQAKLLEKMFEQDDDEDMASEKEDKGTSNDKVIEADTVPMKRVRKRRKVTRTESFMDGTRDVTEWESYSDEEPETRPAKPIQSTNLRSNSSAKDTPKSKKSNSTHKPEQKKQRTLMNFFQKN
ncbi:hypothetical protein HDV02_001447 [Globomyces sp. JEL0801]|nr:hypothetical protein HDV02_001447 [Globomyces sp. JEL0801]